MPMTDYLQDAVINATVRNTSYTTPATVYAALYSVSPTESSSGTELTGDGYSRQAVTFSAPSVGSASSNATVTFGAATATWSPVVAVGIVDASSSGNILYYNGISTRVINNGDSLVINSGDITLTIT